MRIFHCLGKNRGYFCTPVKKLIGSNAAVKKKRTCRYDCTELCQLQGTGHGTCQGSICKCSSLNTIVEHINEHET
ncbi:hypothetical protein HW555_007002 [Spodoptera exigua]|uniref:Uncharacterized protein n=1 Tax=Spodoptera exigua TaxID=7107 RepID=A0A835L4V1_SPOEX|nr:hypothetical protein HW555_007002 [Spodoptera exigua]